MTAEPAFVSVDEAASFLGVGRDTVYRLARSGELPSTELRKRTLIPRAALELVLERALDGFDPDRLLASLAGAAGSSTRGSSAAAPVEEPTTTAGTRPGTEVSGVTPPSDPGARSRAPAVALLR